MPPETKARPLTAITGLRCDAAAGTFSLKFKPYNPAGRVVHQHKTGYTGEFVQSHIAPWQLDAAGISVVSVVEAMQHPGLWCEAHPHRQLVPHVTPDTDEEGGGGDAN
jgi:hypothetical protein